MIIWYPIISYHSVELPLVKLEHHTHLGFVLSDQSSVQEF